MVAVPIDSNFLNRAYGSETLSIIPASQNNLHIYNLAGNLARALPETEMSTSLLPGLPLGKPSQATRIG